ncbi:hypothetical protein AVBRAN9334_05165, partial [Campylobacter sp. RM9334]|uniref:Ig-like domain-containing protein n=2 Tax=unclassified Campylobacter TaxID=2593542 RepID=UPI001DA8ACB2|nr:hypothetical protein [Campylobacter sp. RM9334]
MAEAGKIIKLIGDVKAINVNGEKSLNVGDAVSLNDTIRTIGKDTSVDIELSSGKVLHIVGDNVAKIDNSILTSESFENEAAIDDKINNLINNLVNNNGEIELDATAAGEAGAAGATGTLNDVVFDQSGSESTVYADVLSREVDNNVITNFNNNGLGAANLNDLLAQGNQVTPEINGEANNGEIPTIPGNNGANDNVVPENPENNTGNNTQPEVKPEEKPENTEDVVTPEVKPEDKPEEDKTEDNTQPEVKPEEDKTEDVVTPEVKPEEDKTEDNTQPEVKPEEKPLNLTANVYDKDSNIVDGKLTNGTEFTIKGSGATPNSEVTINVIGYTLDGNNVAQIHFPVKVTADANGDYSYTFDLSNAELLYKYHVENGNNSVDSSFSVDNIAPVITDTKVEVVEGNVVVSGKTEPEAVVSTPNGDKATADKDGNFVITIPNASDKVEISATDKVGNTSVNPAIIEVPASENKPEEDKTEDVVTPEVKPEDKPENTEDNKQPEEDKTEDVVTPEVKPEDKPENTEDNKQPEEDKTEDVVTPEVKPEDKPVAPVFDKLVITEVNGDDTIKDHSATVDSNSLVLKGKLENYQGVAGDYEFDIQSNILNSVVNDIKVVGHIDADGTFTINLDANIIGNNIGLIQVKFEGKADVVTILEAASKEVDAKVDVEITGNGVNVENTLNNNKVLTISGTIKPVDANGNAVEFVENKALVKINDKVVDVTFNKDGSFTTTYTPEKDGEVKVEVTYNVNDKIVSDVATTTIDTTAPLLGELTGTPDLNGNYVVEGKTEPNAVVTINGKTEVKADADGNFKATLNDVKDGEKLELVAKDEAGNISNVGTINAKLDTKEG